MGYGSTSFNLQRPTAASCASCAANLGHFVLSLSPLLLSLLLGSGAGTTVERCRSHLKGKL
jgi:hypothetical protein